MIAASGLAAAHGDRIIFENVSIQVGAGRLGLLCGANGAGKSTLLRILGGLASPAAGRAQPGAPGRGLAWLGHSPAVYAELTALENLEFWADAAGACRAGLRSWLERFGLGRFAHERAGNFSRGMIQRLALARTFMDRPAALLLDEPSSFLDQSGRLGLLRELGLALERGACALAATHEPDLFSPLEPGVFRLGRHGLRPAGVAPIRRQDGQDGPCCA